MAPPGCVLCSCSFRVGYHRSTRGCHARAQSVRWFLDDAGSGDYRDNRGSTRMAMAPRAIPPRNRDSVGARQCPPPRPLRSATSYANHGAAPRVLDNGRCGPGGSCDCRGLHLLMAGASGPESTEAFLNGEVLRLYLNDHMAGSIAAMELVDHLAQLSKGTEREGWFLELGSEIEEDHQALRLLIERVGGKQSTTRNTAAWLAEKVAWVKLKVDDPGTGHLRFLEALETLGLGIQGKLGLWRVLRTISDDRGGLGPLDLSNLEQRAQDQFERVERERVAEARAAFGS